ncbi:hypothetical protein [Vibrio crassostreae]|uniref:hypothetical protein n=1 Tax=Vibrio crassostreae TaxID=246167 RepID=UPI001B3074F7|nr:hypothetical protein [Vibrio crassostreae]
MSNITTGTPLYITYAFIFVGVGLDLVKSLSPALAFRLKEQSEFAAGIFFIIMILIMSLSFAASTYSLQNGITKSLEGSQRAQIATAKVKAIQSEIRTLESLHSTQIDANHITKASETSVLISEANSKLTTLLDQTSGANSDTFLSKFSSVIAYTIAASLELICLAMTLALHHLKAPQRITETQQNTMNHGDTELVSNYPQTPVSIGETGVATIQACSPSASKQNIVVHQAEVFTKRTEEQIIQELKQALVAQEITPTQRSVYSKFKADMTQRQVPYFLGKLADLGHLIAQENGQYKLA